MRLLSSHNSDFFLLSFIFLHTPYPLEGNFYLSYIDEFVDLLLREDRVCDIALPRLTRRAVLVEARDLEDRISPLEDELLLLEEQEMKEQEQELQMQEMKIRDGEEGEVVGEGGEDGEGDRGGEGFKSTTTERRNEDRDKITTRRGEEDSESRKRDTSGKCFY